MGSLFDIPPPEVTVARLSVADAGRVFWWKGRLFRGIAPGDVAHVRRLFDSGLVAALVEKGLLVKSWIAPLALEGYGLVVEHEVIAVPTYPREWTWSMLRDAALLVLEVNEIAARHGYQTKDCHGYNVLFKGSRPVFVDLGSFMQVADRDVLFSYHEFMRSYWYPLEIWRSGGQYLGVRAVPAVGSLFPPAAYLKYRWPILRRVREAALTNLVQRWHAVRTLRHREMEGLDGRYPGWLVAVLTWVRKLGLFSRAARIASLKARIGRLAPPAETTAWSDYHDGLTAHGARGANPRFEHVAGRVAALGAGSVLEIAGNQGALARLLGAAGIETVICTDRDGHALDKGYRAAKRDGAGIAWAILDPYSAQAGPPETPPQERFRADAVIALALTHHLVLTQGLPLGHVLEVIGRFAGRFVLVEFMPKGLHDGGWAPALPSWYNEEWFRSEFTRRFDLLERTALEENRVLYVGKTR
jgi:hypothetical protein